MVNFLFYSLIYSRQECVQTIPPCVYVRCVQRGFQRNRPKTVSSALHHRSSFLPSIHHSIPPSPLLFFPPNACLNHPDSHLPRLMMSSHHVSVGWLAASPIISYTHRRTRTHRPPILADLLYPTRTRIRAHRVVSPKARAADAGSPR